QPPDIAGNQQVEKLNGAGAAKADLSHMGDVEDAGILAHGGMFGDLAAVIDRHFPSCKGNDAGAEALVDVVKGCSSKFFVVGHPEPRIGEVSRRPNWGPGSALLCPFT